MIIISTCFDFSAHVTLCCGKSKAMTREQPSVYGWGALSPTTSTMHGIGKQGEPVPLDSMLLIETDRYSNNSLAADTFWQSLCVAVSTVHVRGASQEI